MILYKFLLKILLKSLDISNIIINDFKRKQILAKKKT